MKKFLKWIGIVLGGLVGLTLLAGLVLYPIGMKSITRTYPNITVESVNIPTDANAIARGRHVSVIWACTKCHGEDLSGRLLTNDPIEGTILTFGSIPAPNLTSGEGGIGQSYTEADWVRAMRHGVKPDAQVEILMFNYSTMSDQDLGDLIAYLKQIPPVDSDLPVISYGPFLPIAPALGIFTPAAELIDHNAPHPENPAPGATVEYGKYLSAICAQCHGNGIANAVKNWKQEDFIRTFNTGVLPDGRQLGSTMSSQTFNEMNDMELTALWLYGQNVSPTQAQR
jgi:mono/diheme cytochrome c family protein